MAQWGHVDINGDIDVSFQWVSLDVIAMMGSTPELTCFVGWHVSSPVSNKKHYHETTIEKAIFESEDCSSGKMLHSFLSFQTSMVPSFPVPRVYHRDVTEK